MKKRLNWKEVGQVFSVFLNVFTVIRDALTSQGIGLEILEWLTSDGKEVFIKQFLTPLGDAFLAAQRVMVVDDSTIRVSLDALPMLPFDGATVETNKAGGWVTVQKRADGLYVDDRKVILHRSEHQQNGEVIQGYALRDEVTNLPVLHPNIMDALCEHAHLIPEDWKKDENGTTFIYFWAVTFRDLDGGVYVRYLCWYGGAWDRRCLWLAHVFPVVGPAAVLASN